MREIGKKVVPSSFTILAVLQTTDIRNRRNRRPPRAIAEDFPRRVMNSPDGEDVPSKFGSFFN
jgi:hypothetical protein